jgi:hypothetical protein
MKIFKMNNYIKDLIVEYFSNTSLFEMAYTREKYMLRLFNLKTQIIENWCLIHYCSLTNRTETKKHWGDELSAHIDNLRDMTIKTSKKRATEQEYLDNLELDNPIKIKHIIKNKFKKENIDITTDVYEKVCDDFASYGIHEIIDIICMNYSDENDDYIDDYIYNKI